MYHKVDTLISEGLTTNVEKLENQLQYLTQKGYKSYHLSELTSLRELPHEKNVVITFDDGYVNQFEHAVPLLKKYGLKATFFIPLKYIGGKDEWNPHPEPIMDVETLQGLPDFVELAYHSHAHRKYNELSMEEIEEDTQRAIQAAANLQLKMHASVAYPYGKFPREVDPQMMFFQHLNDNGFAYGLRIGNKVNEFPFKNRFEVHRIDVKGEWGLSKFKRRLRYGKLL